MNKKLLAVSAAIICGACAYADEGMWMVNAISKALVQNMESKGLKLRANEIYSEDAVSLKDAIVSLDFGCSGSIISDDGLLITNHHCAYADVHALSTKEHNYLEDGFWAFDRKDEVYIPGKSIFFLKKILDVTDEVNRTTDELKQAGKPFGMRKLSFLIEKKYKKETGLEASLSSMWSGSKYYLALYEVYTDIRLVAAPPVSIAAFGGDIDNWEWPQQKCDFAMYRIYTGPDGKPAAHSDSNIPYKPARKLKICRSGIQPGDFAMVMGYPGRTDRYASAAKVNYQVNESLPISNKIRGDIMDMMKSAMDADPDVRLKYADRFFSLSNVQELNAGEVLCYKRFGVVDEKKAMERKLLAERKGLLDSLDAKYKSTSDIMRSITYYRETMIRGSRLGIVATKLGTMARRKDSSDKGNVLKSIDREYAEMDMPLEKRIFRYCLETYLENMAPEYMGPYQKELKSKFGNDYDALCAYLWVDRKMTAEDNICRFFNDVTTGELNKKLDEIQGTVGVADLGREYTRALYRKRMDLDMVQYPDANSTMRLTYGTVGGYSPRDGVECSWQSTTSGILEKYDPKSYDFSLKPDWKAMLEGQKLPANFLTDNDITGGNSGSPVMNAKGELIGLAFDGNKESLASDVSFTPGYNKCVCVDIRFVLWTLEHYAHMDKILKELR